MKLSVIVPCHNEEISLIPILEKINQVQMPGVSKEVIVIDDGSLDSSPALLKAHPHLYDIAIFREKNGGKGAAVKDGLLRATGDYVLFQDADLEYDPMEYSRLLPPIVDGAADAVIGSRFLAPQTIRVHYFYNQLGNKALTLFFNLLFNTTFSDIYSCYLLFRRSLLDPHCLKTMGFQQHAEILCHCLRNGKTFYEVAITYHGRTVSEGKQIKASHAFGVAWTMLRGRFTRKSYKMSNKIFPFVSKGLRKNKFTFWRRDLGLDLGRSSEQKSRHS